MKNPFLNTKDYMIVREVERISNKKRSQCNSSNSSIRSVDSSKYLNNVGYDSYLSSKARANRQYLVYQAKSPVYQVQKKRAEIFGVEELRYRPAYFDRLTSPKEKQQKKLTSQKGFRETALKSQRSAKQLKLTDPKHLSIIQKIQVPLNQRRISANSAKKRASLLSQMIDLQHINNNQCRLNQFYASAMDLRSKGELFQSPKYNINVHTPQNKTRKNSIFETKKPDLKELRKFSSESSSQIDEFIENSEGESKNEQKNKLNQIQESDIPPVITVRKKIYYKYCKNKIR